MLAPIKWRNSDCHFRNDNNNCNDLEKQPLLPCKHEKQKHLIVAREIVQASDLDLLSDYKYLVISVGLSFIFALSTDFTKMFPYFLAVGHHD